MKSTLRTKPGTVQRTLVVTVGQLAQEAGCAFVDLLKKRRGPEAAIAIVSGLTNGRDGDYLTAVTDALTHISPPDLVAQLAVNGWTLTHADEVALILLIDTVPSGGDIAKERLQAMTGTIHKHIGVEATSLLIWLVGEDGETVAPASDSGRRSVQTVSDCLLPPIPATRAIIPLGLRNEMGLRLPDNQALTAICAELLWALTATPMQTLPEWVVEQQNYAHAGHAPLIIVGLAGWEWSSAATHAAFVNRWLESVLVHWLADASGEETMEAVAAWMQANHISQNGFAIAVTIAEEKHLPKPVFASWHFPWPWQLHPLLTNRLLQAESDIEACDQWHQVACLQLNEPVLQATAVLQQHIESMLGQQPVAGISRVDIWLEKCVELCDQQIEQLLEQAEQQTETDNMLIAHQNELQKQLDGWFASWPTAGWRGWLNKGSRPWRWPQLGWAYWHIHQTGQQLNYLLAQQATQRRQHIVNHASQHIWEALQKNIHRLQCQTEEIGDMLHHFATEFTPQDNSNKPQSSMSPSDGFAPTNHQSPIKNISIPHAIYQQLIQNDEAEAIATAATLGGLGQHVQKLDDTLFFALPRLAAERLAQVWQITAVDALIANANDPEQVQQWRQQGMDAACPLWRPDETRLQETDRMQSGRFAFLCGAEATLLPVSSMQCSVFSGLSPEETPPPIGDLLQDEPVYRELSNDKERLLLLRIRTGLTAEAMIDGRNQT